MEECWNYMAEESGPPAQAKPSVRKTIQLTDLIDLLD